jgi:hypothetical protein
VGDIRTSAPDTVEFSGLLSVNEWVRTADMGEVRRLRVAPKWRRRGVATALMRGLIRWSIARGLRSLVLNTTAAQLPALALYRSLGIREIGRTYLGVYELVWMIFADVPPTLNLDAVQATCSLPPSSAVAKRHGC